MSTTENSGLIQAGDAARLLGISVSRLRQLCATREIPFIKLTRRAVRFDPQRLRTFIAERSIEPQAPGAGA